MTSTAPTVRSSASSGTNVLSGAALIGFDGDLRVRVWNEAAEQLTGIAAAEVVGRHCWEVVGSRAEDGSPFCGPGCPLARTARHGGAVPCNRLVLEAVDGPRTALVSTVTVDGEQPLFVHVICESAPLQRPSVNGHAHLTRREYQVLELLARGIPAKVIAPRLGISVATVRNHIRSILAKLQAQSQLEALARARDLGIV